MQLSETLSKTGNKKPEYRHAKPLNLNSSTVIAAGISPYELFDNNDHLLLIILIYNVMM